ncbi:MAG: transposase, partial [Acidimicrobiales bacterium]
MARDPSGPEVAVLMVERHRGAAQCCAAALLVTDNDTKVPVGLWLGDTENKTVVTALLADLVTRGLSAEGGLLVVMDGAKALATGGEKVLGEKALGQRCTLYKRRNVKGLPQKAATPIVAEVATV